MIRFSDSETEILQKVKDAAKALGTRCFLVGGFIRDRILGRDAGKDMDFVTLGDGIELAREVARRFDHLPQVNYFKNFGTAHIKTDDAFDLEFVGARKESYSPESRKPAVSAGSLEDDQLRRDFTINAMALELAEGKMESLVDPSNGMSDLENRILRTPQEPSKTFSDDPLRI